MTASIVKAAEAKRSPLILLLFPFTLRQLPTLAWAASVATKSATVPLSLHLDHAQDVSQIEVVVRTLPFDSIMVDMSHYDHEGNLGKTAALTELCHERGIAVEAESGRINGGEDGIADTGDLEVLFTTPKEVEDFLKAGIDILAPSVGNLHGDYGPKGPELDLARLSSIYQQIRGRAAMALHGTNDFTAEIMQDCIKAGTVKLNVNKLLLEVWHVHLKDNTHKPFMQRVDEGIEILQAEVERWIEICGSAGKA
ncbi:tagatose 1 6-diphosphate aldolase [Fusarium subglutinans]|uniref:Fructose-bisphosphate aldolase n=1 Tax=Gibberella subglutinans TaxID=42677 RepID=A0A8H5Q277_GIBSU|nr:tagatose 1 6-diphosphate aldolase [Fusarium subglutinans]KAF5608110.1 tagatose 1 6-diphosphate aldolase [Fusarium subglutinans]